MLSVDRTDSPRVLYVSPMDAWAIANWASSSMARFRRGKAADAPLENSTFLAALWAFKASSDGVVASASVQGNTGKLFRIDLDDDAPYGREIHQIGVEPLVGGDGLLLDHGDLIVVQFDPSSPPTLTFVKLNAKAERGKVVERRTDPTLREPSTVARARNFYLVVNADFGASATPFTVSCLPRNDDEDDY